MDSFMQWNLQLYKTKFNELKYMLSTYSPIALCIQETLASNRTLRESSGYSVKQSDVTRNDMHERGGAILINKRFQYEKLHLNTELQTVPVRVCVGKAYAICSVYLAHTDLGKQKIADLIDQLPQPFLIMGDMNAKSLTWGDSQGGAPIQTNRKGTIFEELTLEKPITILNNGQPTYFHIQTGTYSAIGLSICSAESMLDFKFEVLSNLHDSDHYPIQLKLTRNICPLEVPKTCKVKEADWGIYTNLSSVVNINVQDMTVEDFNVAVAKRKRAERALKNSDTVVNRIAYKRLNAICRRALMQAKRVMATVRKLNE